MVTIKDVARLANVAPSSVSYVINGTKRLKPETEARIREVIRELNYTPNHMARSLKTNHTSTIGVLTPNITIFFFTEIIEALESQLVKSGYSIVLCNYYEDIEKGNDRIALLTKRGIDGLVILEGGDQLDTSLAQSQNIPIVSIDAQSDRANHSILVDNYDGAYAATDLLLKKGRENILLLSNSVSSQAFVDRTQGYRDALRDNMRGFDPAYVIESPISFEGGYRRVRAFLAEGLPFDGLFATSYYLALGAMRAISNTALRIPKDILLVGFDDPPDAAFTVPSMTSVRQPMREMGELAAQLILDSLCDEGDYPKTHILKPRLIEREST